MLLTKWEPSRRRTAAAGVALIALVLSVSSCHDGAKATPAGHPRQTVASASAAPAHVYSAPASSCDLLDSALLEQRLGPDHGNLVDPSNTTSQGTFSGRCVHTFGPPGHRTLVSVQAMLSQHGTAQAYYQGIRAAQQKTQPITDMPGPGQAAFTYVDSQTTSGLTSYDGNLYLDLAISAAPGTPNDTTSTRAVLTQLATHAIASLPTSPPSP
jgi:hypothetical protein